MKVNNVLLTILNENFKSLANKGDVTIYSSFNNYKLLFQTNTPETYKYNSIPSRDKIIFITSYQNMSSLGETRVYQNMSSLGL